MTEYANVIPVISVETGSGANPYVSFGVFENGVDFIVGKAIARIDVSESKVEGEGGRSEGDKN